ncbi:hypothetical protein E0Z10_g1387 [Xylaria hypoxylon]|uniref:DASH complex subunit ASK1 n=1 Tax=Xylaria hypoxylon TaxID=37992 RepID=A0A4Z0YSK8_9PEZI|nr:hypothetical protein E0Z10_g1387 [Xylaria hypoxylon]
MAEEESADVFAFPDFSLSSKWLALPSEPKDQFFSLDVEAANEQASYIANPQLFDTTTNEFFKIPDNFTLSGLNGHDNKSHDFDQIPEPLHDIVLPDLDIIDDLWYKGENQSSSSAEYKTWEGFSLPDIPQKAPLFITEAGPSVYDAAILDKGDPLDFGIADHLVIQSNPYLAALLALTLGRGSVFFIWDARKASFIPAVKEMRISGYSTEVLRGMQDSCLRSGTTTRFLSSYVQLTYSTRSSAVRVALAKAVDVLLLAIQQQFGERGKQVRSLLQLQSLVEPIETMLVYVRDLVRSLSRIRIDEQLLSQVFSETEVLENDNSLLPALMCEILSRVTEPWIDFAEKWIGVKAEEAFPLTKEGPGMSFVKVENVSRVDDFGFEFEEREYVLDEDRMPNFIPPDIALVMFEAGKNLRLLRTHYPGHPLCHIGIVTSNRPPELKWLFDWGSIGNVQEEVKRYEKAMLQRILGEPTEEHIQTKPEVRATSGEQCMLQVFGSDSTHLEKQLLASIQALDQAPPIAVAQDALSPLLEKHLFRQIDPLRANASGFDLHWSLIPLHSFGPLVTSQARLINREYMKLLFDAHDLKEHLRVQKEFQLLGNGMFCSRLSHALFDPDLETAERQAGVALNGGIMGLRMNGRETWPPASSELRLALMGVLSDVYLPPTLRESSPLRKETPDLPGDLSFALRDLPPGEIDKCMDPSSLEALDFLRLAYKTPAPLSPILTSAILIKYDKIFKLLLRVLRMLYVVGQLFRDTSRMEHQGQDTGDAWRRFQFEAQHLVQSVSAYFFDTGIQMPWLEFERWLDGVQSDLARVDVDMLNARVVSPDEVREEHEKMLDRIMNRLLLRKRQQPILALLEEIFRLTMRFSRQVQLEVSGKVEGDASRAIIHGLYQTFRKKVEVFITVCHGLGERGGTAERASKRDLMNDDERRSDGMDDENTIDRLLINLDMLEIDHNFSKAHRIVTSSILPLVEQYGEHSKNVWEASKFWKQFFEASANVSLSGYEELAGEIEETITAEETTIDETTSDYDATQDDTTAESSEYQEHQQQTHDAIEDSLLEDATITGSTPRPPATKSMHAQFADFGSPYQALRRELKSGAVFKDDLPVDEDEDEYGEAADGTVQLPPYHGSTSRLPDMSMTPRSSSLLLDEPTLRPQSAAAQKAKDLLLHRVLDKNYRLQATPLKAVPLPSRARGRSPQRKGAEEEPEEDRTRRALWADSPMSSPEMAVPKLRSDLYMSPLKTRGRSGGGAPRTPGVSVQTPATARKRDIFAEARVKDHDKGKGRERDEITWDSDEDDNDEDSVFGGMSPPKTIQFALPPSKLLQTPAREASRRIVDDILITAGAAPEESSEYSPTMVKMNHNILDDSF